MARCRLRQTNAGKSTACILLPVILFPIGDIALNCFLYQQTRAKVNLRFIAASNLGMPFGLVS